MKAIIVDTNILFSSILNPNSKVGDLLLNSSDCFEFYAPAFLRVEIEKHKERIIAISGLNNEELEEAKNILFQRILFINEALIPFKIWHDSAVLLRDIDSDDVPFVAAATHLQEDLWTGDLKLLNGLKGRAFSYIISTQELYDLREEMRENS